MFPDIKWLAPLYGFSPDCRQISVPEKARPKLLEMAKALVGTSSLVAIYISEGAKDGYGIRAMRGRVAGAVRLVEKPSHLKLEDFYCDDLEGKRRWPIGWPCQVVLAPHENQCPVLREHVESVHGSFAAYAGQFQRGPFALDPVMRDRLNRDFGEFNSVI